MTHLDKGYPSRAVCVYALCIWVCLLFYRKYAAKNSMKADIVCIYTSDFVYFNPMLYILSSSALEIKQIWVPASIQEAVFETYTCWSLSWQLQSVYCGCCLHASVKVCVSVSAMYQLFPLLMWWSVTFLYSRGCFVDSLHLLFWIRVSVRCSCGIFRMVSSPLHHKQALLHIPSTLTKMWWR